MVKRVARANNIPHFFAAFFYQFVTAKIHLKVQRAVKNLRSSVSESVVNLILMQHCIKAGITSQIRLCVLKHNCIGFVGMHAILSSKEGENSAKICFAEAAHFRNLSQFFIASFQFIGTSNAAAQV